MITQRSQLFHTFTMLGFALLCALAFAFYAEYIGGHEPCEYCIYQRYLLGMSALIFIAFPRFHRLGAFILCVAFLLTLYQFGLEQKWWTDRLGRCVTHLPSHGELTRDSIKAMLVNTPIVRCDQVNWVIFGYSAVLWNLVFNATMLIFYGFLKYISKGLRS